MSDVATLISALNDYGFEDSSTNTKVREIQNAIRDIEKMRPWPFLEASILLTFDGSADSPNNMPVAWKSTLKVWDITGRRRVRPIRLDDFDELVGADFAQAGAPQVYWNEGNSLNFWPIPPATQSVRLRYLQWSAAITSSSPESAILIPPRHHEAIQLGALLRLYDMEDDPELAVRFEARYQKLLADMVEDCFRLQFDQPDFVHHITDGDDYEDL
jgi:hypothetical protein